MKTLSISIVALFFLFASCTNKDSDLIIASVFPDTLKVQINEAIQISLHETNVPGVTVGVWIDGHGSYTTSAGTSNIENNAAIETDVHFRVGSITKTFTAIAVLQLVDDNLITLDEPIQTYLPEKNIPRGDEITVRMLGDMTSGLFSYTFDSIFQMKYFGNPYKEWEPDSLLAIAFSHPNLFDPGTEFFYCNTNTVILGLLIEKITGNSVNQVFEERIFKPLSMDNTEWPKGSFMPQPYSHGYSMQTLDGLMADATYWNPSWAFTAGQLISNIYDLQKHIESISTGSLISTKMYEEQRQWTIIPSKGKYGFGIAEMNGWLGHTGSIPGYNTIMYKNKEQGVTLIINVNSDIQIMNEGSPVDTFFQNIAKVVTPNNTPFVNSNM